MNAVDFQKLIGAAEVRAAGDADAVDDVRPRWVVEPADAAGLARALAAASREQWSVLPRGGGTKIDWGNPPLAADVVLSTRRLDRVVEHAAGDMTVTVQAGCTIAALQDVLARGGQRLALDPLWPARATVGGVLATADAGPLRAAYGSLRDLVIGMTVALPDGTLARSGGKVVKNVAGYDLPKLMTGALGTLGVITEATFRLHPLPRASRTFAFAAPSPDEVKALVLAVLDAPLTVTGLQAVVARGAPATVLVRVDGSPQSVDAQAPRLAELARRCGAADAGPGAGAWGDREALWEGAGGRAVAKVTALPTQLADLCGAIDRSAPAGDGTWRAVLQGVGTGLVRYASPRDATLAASLRSLRREVGRFGGSLVLLTCPPNVKQEVGVWGEPGDALSLMRRVKDKFDPERVLNPGRLVGGI